MKKNVLVTVALAAILILLLCGLIMKRIVNQPFHWPGRGTHDRQAR